MINLWIDEAKQPHEVRIYEAKELCNDILRNELKCYRVTDSQNTSCKGYARRIQTYDIGYGYHTKRYLNMCCSFDIETTLANDENSYMWIWQFSLSKDAVVVGRKWKEYIDFIKQLRDFLKPTKTMRLIVAIHNASYEFQFIKHRINITDSFCKSEREILFFEQDSFIEYRDTLALTNMSLKKLAESFTNTKKCVGDLDYSIQRNSKYDIFANIKELQYCVNDVLILSEYMETFFAERVANGFLPLTQTAILRKMVKDSYNTLSDKQKACYSRFKPKTEQEYNILMQYVYRGGYVHANADYVGELMKFAEYGKGKLHCVDFTSSYPSVMLYNYYPTYFENGDYNNLNSDIDTKCVIMLVTFHNLRAKTSHSIESKSKCIYLSSDADIDNGRVHNAECMTVWLNELDYKNYMMFYTWEKKDIKVYKVSKRIRCPKYLIDNVIQPYITKSILKAQGENYANEKAIVNSAYGLTVARVITESIKFIDDSWIVNPTKPTIEQLERNCLSPFIGVWVSAHARYNLLKCLYHIQVECGADVIYCDTDSIKFIENEKAVSFIKQYNEEIAEKMNESVELYNIADSDKPHLFDLGMFDREYEHTLFFKTMGCKRYIIVYEKKGFLYVNQTIAGLPKNILFKDIPRKTLDTGVKVIEYTQDNIDRIIKILDSFNDGLKVEKCKLTHYYNDNPSSCWVDGELMFEYSNISLIESDFTMNLDDDWIYLFLETFVNSRKERRIYG